MIWLAIFHLACTAIVLELIHRAPNIEDME
jgi:hypothetical protein